MTRELLVSIHPSLLQRHYEKNRFLFSIFKVFGFERLPERRLSMKKHHFRHLLAHYLLLLYVRENVININIQPRIFSELFGVKLTRGGRKSNTTTVQML
jgi:hypothetical protein